MDSALAEGEGTLTETDWFEAFGWITADVTLHRLWVWSDQDY